MATWHTEAVLGLCHYYRDTGDVYTPPVLADALEDAGFDGVDVLGVLRGPTEDTMTYRLAVATVMGGEPARALQWLMDFGAQPEFQAGYYEQFRDDDGNWDYRDTQLAFSDLMAAAETYTRDGEWLTQHGGQSWQAVLAGREEEFWTNFETATGIRVPPGDKRWGFFRCSC